MDLTLLDTLAYVKGKPQNEYYIVFVGENKARRSESQTGFTDDEKGQLVSYLQEVLKYQPTRHEITGIFSII